MEDAKGTDGPQVDEFQRKKVHFWTLFHAQSMHPSPAGADG